mgnify:CR=1 FL=1
MDVSDFRIALQIPAILSVIPVMKDLGAYLYMMDILSATDSAPTACSILSSVSNVTSSFLFALFTPC